MGRQNSDPAIVGSSIALLQERFKKLERIKEKREEERQLMFSDQPKRNIMPTNYSSYNNSFSDELLFLPSGPAAFDQDPLSLGLYLNSRHADYRALKIKTQSSFSFLWSADKRAVKTLQICDISDVDTSLHL
ncbi:hypothetical protein ACH5RR_018439 [Cinchona calisaya]|uniref:Uncharacterized protein n=1 Tax=Cinchona calisaya TaxID=153742 RepID=A0ABD2ZQ36_9GENT